MTAAGAGSRIAAYQALRRVHAAGAWSTRAVDEALRRSRLDARDRAFAANLAYETLRWEGTLDWALSHAVTRPLEAVQDDLLDVLRLGAWQVLYGRLPDRAAVGTTVEVARAQVGERTTGFVNGALRGLLRRRDALPWPSERDDRGLGLALGYPAWVVGEARASFGERARAVLEAGNAAPGVTLRAVGDRDALVAELRAAGLEPVLGGLALEAVRAPGADPADLVAVAQGRAVVQDEASMLVTRAVAVAAGGLSGVRVLDVAAAPGGKSTHLAQLGARVVAADLRPARARLVADLAARTGLGARVAALAADAAAPPLRANAFDAVLLDAPCTGLGVVRRRPELRWRRDADDPRRLAALQVDLLEHAAAQARPGGVVVYSACTWTRAETGEVMSAFLASHGDRFEPVDVAAGLGLGGRSEPGGGLQLDPDRDGVDGMYLAAARRRG